MLLGAGALFGARLAEEKRRECEQAEAVLAVFSEAKIRIETGGEPMEEILTAMPESRLFACGYRGKTPATFEALFSAASLSLPADVAERVRQAAAEIGRGYREAAAEKCGQVIRFLAPYAEKLRAELPKRRKTAHLLPVTAAGMIGILLL